MKRSSAKTSKWQDHYARKAKQERYPARSVYKLEGIQKKFAVIAKGDRVLDLGCAPGSWLLHAAELVGDNGAVVGVDPQPVTIKVPRQVAVFTGDIFNPDEALRQCFEERFQVVLSDMAPNTTGNKDVDAARSYNLCEAALGIAETYLHPGGSFVCKIFQGEAFQSFSAMVKSRFSQQRIFKPQSSRKASKEIYVIGIGKNPIS